MRERLLERRLEPQHRMLLVDEALAAEKVELADPHRQHRQVAAPHLGRRRPPVELVHREEQPPVAVAQLEGVDVVLAEPERAHRDAADLDGLAVLELVDPDPAAIRMNSRCAIPPSQTRKSFATCSGR